jgi:hypothetical protein
MNARNLTDFADFTVTASRMWRRHRHLHAARLAAIAAAAMSPCGRAVTAILGPNGGRSHAYGADRPTPTSAVGALMASRWRTWLRRRRPHTWLRRARHRQWSLPSPPGGGTGLPPHARRSSARRRRISSGAAGGSRRAPAAPRAITALSGEKSAFTSPARWRRREPVDAPGCPTGGCCWTSPPPDLQHQHNQVLHIRQHSAQPGRGVVVVLHDLNPRLHADHRLPPLQVAASGPSADVLTPERIAAVWACIAALPVRPSTYTCATTTS